MRGLDRLAREHEPAVYVRTMPSVALAFRYSAYGSPYSDANGLEAKNLRALNEFCTDVIRMYVRITYMHYDQSHAPCVLAECSTWRRNATPRRFVLRQARQIMHYLPTYLPRQEPGKS